VGLAGGDRLVLDAARHDQEIPLLEPHHPVAEVHVERALDDQEELVLGVVPVPDELPRELGELDVLAVERGHDARRPGLADARELLGEADSLGHPPMLPAGRRRREAGSIAGGGRAG
jgi:hypothetical protein